MKKIIHTDKAPKAVGPYSQAIEMGPFLFCSGQISINPDTNEVELGPVEEQTHRCFSNIKAVLAKADLNLSHVVKTTVFLKEMSDFAKVNDVYAEYFSNEPPARSCVAVKELPKGVDVEVEVLAYRG